MIRRPYPQRLKAKQQGSSIFGTVWKQQFQGHWDSTFYPIKVINAAWYYPEPTPDFSALKDHVAFYPGLMDACYVNEEKVKAQEGDFYGGWITRNIVGPFKGEAGTRGW